MKKLVYLANIKLPSEKAHSVQIMKMCEAFADAGVDVTLVIPNRKLEIREDPYEYYGVRNIFRIIRIPSIDLIRPTPFWFRLHYLSFTISSFFYVILFARGAYIYSRHDVIVWLFGLFSSRVCWEIHARGSSPVFRFALRRAAHLITISNGLKNFLVKNFKIPAKHILVAHDGIDAATITPRQNVSLLRRKYDIPINARVVAYIGKYTTMGEEKGVDDIIVAFASVAHTMTDALLLLVGIGENENRLIYEVIDRNQIDRKRVIIVNHVPHRNALEYMRLADVLVMYYPRTSHYAHVMSPLKMFEYMASGVPIITSDLPAVREILDEKSACFVPPEYPHALARSMIYLLEDKQHSELLAQKAQEKVKNYTWGNRTMMIMQKIGI